MKLVILSLLVAVTAAWDSNCGRNVYGNPPMPYIVGGRNANKGQFPWQVSLTDSRGRHFCGGVVINQQWVLTAAHCLVGESTRSVRVVFGEHDRRQSDSQNRDRIRMSINRLIMHERYDVAAEEDADIALVRASSRIPYNNFIKAACKPERGNSYSGATSLVSGWGTTRSGGSLSNILKWISTPVQSNSVCSREMRPATITSGMICAGRVPENEKDSCQGDSGGPLVVQRSGRYQIVGIVSWGFGCASGTPGVYARVTEYIPWIDSKI